MLRCLSYNENRWATENAGISSYAVAGIIGGKWHEVKRRMASKTLTIGRTTWRWSLQRFWYDLRVANLTRSALPTSRLFSMTSSTIQYRSTPDSHNEGP